VARFSYEQSVEDDDLEVTILRTAKNDGVEQSDDEVEFVESHTQAPAHNLVPTFPVSSDLDLDEVDQLLNGKAPQAAGTALNVTVIVWMKVKFICFIYSLSLTVFQNDCSPVSMAVKHRQVGPHSRLLNLSNSLKAMGIHETYKMDRFVPNKGWRFILWDSWFALRDGDFLVLKVAGVERTKDFDTHVEHLFI
jgi:hypothetical protein